MKKLLKPSDLLLLGLGGFLDFVEEMKDPFGLFNNYYSTFYDAVPARYRKRNFKHLVWRNLKTGNIEKEIKGSQVFLSLTSAGKQKIKREFPLIRLQNKTWDRKWRLVIFDIEETARSVREIFRRKLKELGFGMLQKSVWVTPFDFLADFKDFVELKNLSKSVVLIETRSLFVDDERELAEKLWRLSEINEAYSEIYYELTQLKNNNEEYLRKYGDRNNFLNHLRRKTVDLFLKDPYLPKELLPEDWLANKVRRLIKDQKVF